MPGPSRSHVGVAMTGTHAAGAVFHQSGLGSGVDVMEPGLGGGLGVGSGGSDALPEVGAFEVAAQVEDLQVQRAGGFAEFVGAFLGQGGAGEGDAVVGVSWRVDGVDGGQAPVETGCAARRRRCRATLAAKMA